MVAAASNNADQDFVPINTLTSPASSSNSSSSSSAHRAAVARSSAAQESLEHCLACMRELAAERNSSTEVPHELTQKLQWHCGLGGQWLLVQVGDWLEHPKGWTGPALALLQVWQPVTGLVHYTTWEVGADCLPTGNSYSSGRAMELETTKG